jgi:hypothetical protein
VHRSAEEATLGAAFSGEGQVVEDVLRTLVELLDEAEPSQGRDAVLKFRAGLTQRGSCRVRIMAGELGGAHVAGAEELEDESTRSHGRG